MGIIKAIGQAIGGTLADQWLEVIEADDMSDKTVFTSGVLIRKGQNTKGTGNTVSNGSIIHVYDNQFMMLVDGGKVVDYTAEPGYYKVDNSSLPSLFNGQFGDSLKDSFNRIKYGGQTPTAQKVFFINLQEIKGIKFGTRNPINYFDNFYNAELFLRAHGTYSVKITNPLQFYAEVIPRNADRVEIDEINEQYLSEFLEALQSSINQMSADGTRISYVTSKARELGKYMSTTLDEEWNQTRGMEIQAVGIASVSYDEESQKLINMRNEGAMLGGDASVLRGMAVKNLTEGVRDAGSNAGGAMTGFMGVGMGMQQFNTSMEGLNAMTAGMAGTQPQAAPQQAAAPQQTSIWISLIAGYVLPIAIFILLGRWLSKKMMSSMGGGPGGAMSFGKSNAKVYVKSSTGIKFSDVAGEDEAKDLLTEIVDYLHNPQKYREIGASMPKGALLVGPPGTGKTLLAKAVAGEAEVPFFSISGSEFVEMFVGMGAAKVRDLFKQANEKAPCIVFIDEIDTIGKKRDGAGFTGGNDEREQTLNQLLTEMDGFDGSKGVVILAATNRPDSLDPALLRPGRFDRRIPVELPDLKGREEILKVHAKKIKIADSVRFDEIAKAAAGASGAELANIVNEAALRAVRDGRKFATQADFEESIEVVIAGYQKKNRVLSNKEKLIVAYHEIGHALVAAKQTESAPVHKITIIPRTSGALGYTMQVDDGDHYLMTKEELANKIATFTGGRAAEELIFHSITTGASNDIEQATKLARAMISRYGMSEDFDMVAMENVTNQYLGGDSSLSCSFETQTLLDKKVVELVRMEHQKALKILQDNIGKLHELAKYLYEHETITGEEFMKILNAPVQVPTAVAESESNTESENNAESENSTEADADTSSGKVNLQK